MLEFLVIFLICGLFGVFSSLLGIGGGLLITPFLTLVFKIPIHQAIATSLIAIIATSSASATVYVQQKLADIKLGITLELATVSGAIIGGFLAGLIGPDALEILFALVLVYVSIWMLRKNNPTENSQHTYQAKKYPLGFLISFVAGNLSGLLGIGGGPIKVPAMYLIMRVPLKVASATSNFMLGVTASASCFLYYFRGEVNLPVSGVAVLGAFLGASWGSHLMFSVKTDLIRKLFVGFLLLLALSMFLKGINLNIY